MLYLPFNMILILADSLNFLLNFVLRQNLRQRTQYHTLFLTSKLSFLIFLILNCQHLPHCRFKLFRVTIIIFFPIVP